jgi:hypothetical protein
MHHWLTLLAIMAVAGRGESTQEPRPWSDTFKCDFHEKIMAPYKGPDQITGTFYYNAKNKMRIDRTDGFRDRFCGPELNRKTQCNQIIRDGWRFLIFPELKLCCRCCSDENGCGPRKPDWFMNGKLMGSAILDGEAVYQWNVNHFTNLDVYAQTMENSLPKRVFREFISDLVFDTKTYTESFEDSVFDLPKDMGDCQKLCRFEGICTEMRKKTTS